MPTRMLVCEALHKLYEKREEYLGECACVIKRRGHAESTSAHRTKRSAREYRERKLYRAKDLIGLCTRKLRVANEIHDPQLTAQKVPRLPGFIKGNNRNINRHHLKVDNEGISKVVS